MARTKKYELFCDFDSTAVNSIKRLVEMLNEKFSKDLLWSNIKMYSATDLFPEATREDVIGSFAHKDFFNGLEIFDGFINVIEKYSNNFNYHIATIGTKDNLENKEKWMGHNFKFKYKYDRIEKDGIGKSSVDMLNGILIDDHIDNLRSSNAKIKILYKGGIETDWNTINEQSEIDKSFMIADNWIEVDKILENILKNNLLEV